MKTNEETFCPTIAGESSKAYAAVTAYCYMGAQRSIARVGRELNKSTTLLERWSTQHHWVARAADFDAAVAQKRQAEHELFVKQEEEKWKQRERDHREALFEISHMALARAKTMLGYPLVKLKKTKVDEAGRPENTDVYPAGWNQNTAARLIEVGKAAGEAAFRQGSKDDVVEEDIWELRDFNGANK